MRVVSVYVWFRMRPCFLRSCPEARTTTLLVTLLLPAFLLLFAVAGDRAAAVSSYPESLNRPRLLHHPEIQ